MDSIARLRAFVRVVDSGSFTRAAYELGLGQPAVSRAVSALEADLGRKLLHRTTRGLSLTEEGKPAYEGALRVLEELARLEGEPTGAPSSPRRVRIACPLALGTLRLIGPLTAFSREHPELEIDLKLSDAFVDLVEDGIDIALRVGALADSNLSAKRVGELPRLVAASRAYLAEHGTPRHPRELAAHRCVVRGQTPADARFRFCDPNGETTVRVSGGLRVDNFLALREAVLAGAGIGLAGSFVFFDGDRLHPALRSLFPRMAPDPLPVHVVFQKDRFLPPRVRMALDFLIGVLENEPWLARRSR